MSLAYSGCLLSSVTVKSSASIPLALLWFYCETITVLNSMAGMEKPIKCFRSFQELSEARGQCPHY